MHRGGKTRNALKLADKMRMKHGNTPLKMQEKKMGGRKRRRK